MQKSPEAVEELRKLFFDKLKVESENKSNFFHPLDIERIRSNETWVNRFLTHHEGDINEALNMIWETCEWRKNKKVNEINEQNVKLEYLKDGSLFPYGCDKDEKTMLVFKYKMHFKCQKDFEELKRCLIYWFERLERQTNHDQITIFFDMMDSGLSNMDMEFSKYIINLNKQYYPSFINYILIFEMPWVLNAAFKIIKSWLPGRAVQKIKFLNKATIKEYVNPNKMLVSWGGEDEYTFSFVPEVRIELSTVCKTEEIKKKTVHFALNHSSSSESSPISSSFRDMKSEDFSSSGFFLIRVIHPDTVHFNWNGTEFVGSINVENISNKNVLYKIKTTSPDRFRVRPNSGFLQQGVSAKITVVLQNGYQIESIARDKFLLMAVVGGKEDATPQEIFDIWKQSENVKIEQHRLRCSVVQPLPASLPPNGNIPSSVIPEDLVDKIENLKMMMYQMCECNKQLSKDISYRQNVITVLLTLLFISVLLMIFFTFKPPSSMQSAYTHPSCPASFNNDDT
ncbi:motile sperm domain-containing protein 2-like [Planococcus citri]|uniref:motile sperm domain-containing protein 2-like n=1 Tax=Planococcus citri TaxID=170843 RepID=UPI0031F7DE75